MNSREIPRILHTIWLGPEVRPKEYSRFLEKFRVLHPTWKVMSWSEGNLLKDLHPAIYETLRQPAERADILRLELLIRFGGVYLDSDMEPVKSFDNLIEGKNLVVCELKPKGRINNAFIASTANHPALMETLEKIRPVKFPGLDKAGTGPYLLDRVLRSYDHTRLEYFHFHARLERDKKKAYAIDYAATSWKSPKQLREDNLRLKNEIAELREVLDLRSKSSESGRLIAPSRWLRSKLIGTHKYVKVFKRLLVGERD